MPVGSLCCKVVWNCDRSCVSGCLCGQPWRFERVVPVFTYLYGGLPNTDASGDYELKTREKSLGLTYRGTWGINSPRVQGGEGEERGWRKKTERSGLMNLLLKSMKLGKRSLREHNHSLVTKQRKSRSATVSPNFSRVHKPANQNLQWEKYSYRVMPYHYHQWEDMTNIQASTVIFDTEKSK